MEDGEKDCVSCKVEGGGKERKSHSKNHGSVNGVGDT